MTMIALLNMLEVNTRTLMGAGFTPKEAVEKVVEVMGEFAPLPPESGDSVRFYLNFQVDEEFAASVRESVFRDVQRQLGVI